MKAPKNISQAAESSLNANIYTTVVFFLISISPHLFLRFPKRVQLEVRHNTYLTVKISLFCHFSFPLYGIERYTVVEMDYMYNFELIFRLPTHSINKLWALIPSFSRKKERPRPRTLCHLFNQSPSKALKQVNSEHTVILSPYLFGALLSLHSLVLYTATMDAACATNTSQPA